MSGKDASCDNGVCTLTITSTALTDSGRYTCEAENIHGKARSETAVTITCEFITAEIRNSALYLELAR